MDIFKGIELLNLYNQAPAEHLEKAMRARHPETGRWVTLNGGESNETGEHHGVHVFIEDGHITKGPKALVDRDAAKKKDAAPKKQQYHIFNNSNKYEPVNGEKVDIHPDLHTFVHKVGGHYQVSEAKTGLKMGKSSPYKGNAIKTTKNALAIMNMDRLKTVMDAHVKKNGAAPGMEDKPEPPKEAPKEENPKKTTTRKKKADPMGEATALREKADRLHAQGHMDGQAHWLATEQHRNVERAFNRTRFNDDPEEQARADRGLETSLQLMRDHVAKHGQLNDQAQKAAAAYSKLAEKFGNHEQARGDFSHELSEGKEHLDKIHSMTNSDNKVEKWDLEHSVRRLAHLGKYMKANKKFYDGI